MQIEQLNFFTLSFTIFILLSSYAQIPVFMSLLADFDVKKQKMIIVREMIFALIILFIFILFGTKVLDTLGIKPPVLNIAGGFLLILIALNMIFPKNSAENQMPKHVPFIVPLALPCIAGPGSITALMVLAKAEGMFFASTALITAWIPSTALLLIAPYIKKILGEKGLLAIERLGGMLIVLIGIQMFSAGIIETLKEIL